MAFGAKDAQTVKAFQEAEAYQGPSLVIAYSHCIAHGYDMAQGIEHQRLAADTATGRSTGSIRGVPTRAAAAGPRFAAAEERRRRADGVETRFQLTNQQDPAHYDALVEWARHQIAKRVALHRELARTP